MNIYEKKSKSINNPYGTEEVKINPLEDPCLLCISAQTMIPKSVFGMIREGMDIARLRTSKQTTTQYDIKDFPIKFLGIGKKSPQDDIATELVDDFFVPLLQEENSKVEINLAKKKFRNINILTYCDGTRTYSDAEKLLQERMKGLGYSKEEQQEILSQISLTSLASIEDTSKLCATSLNIIDVNDQELNTPFLEKLKAILLKNNTKEQIATYHDGSAIFFYEKDGYHSLKNFLQNNNPMKLAASINVVSSLQNSLINKTRDELLPLQLKKQQEKIRNLSNIDKKTVEDKLEDFDKSIDYPSAKRYSSSELTLFSEIDTLCREKINLEKKLETTTVAYQNAATSIESLTSAIKLNTTEDIYYDILEQGLGYQRPLGKTNESSYFETPKAL